MKNPPTIRIYADDSQTSSPALTRASSSTETSLHFAKAKEVVTANKPAYKSIQIKELPSKSSSTSSFKPCVSFDTVAISFSEDGHGLLSDDEDGLDGHSERFHNERRGRSSSPFHRVRSPSSSPYRTRSPSPYEHSIFDGLDSDIDRLPVKGSFDSNGWRIDYPTESAIRNDAFTRTIRHPNFKEYIKEKIPRTFIVYLTGRQHTWIALDYTIAKLLRDGDHIVIVSRVPSSFTDEVICKGDGEWIHKSLIDPKIFKKIVSNLQRYVNYISNPKIIFQLTIDIYFSSSTADVLGETIEIYEPEFIITSTKPNLRFQRVTTWKTARISDRLVKNFDIPIIVVPAFSLNEFELQFFQTLEERHNLIKDSREQDLPEGSIPSSIGSLISLEENNEKNNIVRDDKVSEEELEQKEEGRDDDNNYEDTEDSENSDDISSVESSSSTADSRRSYVELTRTISNYNDILDHFNEDTDEALVNDQIFLEKLNKVSDISKKMAEKFADFSHIDSEGGDLVRTLTGLPKLEKHKSMLDVLESSGDDIATLKKNLRLNQQNNGILDTHPNTGSRTIKFSNEIDSRSKTKPNEMDSLRRYKTNVDTVRPGPNTLKPTVSQPQFTKTLSESQLSSTKTKKKGFFKNLFKR